MIRSFDLTTIRGRRAFDAYRWCFEDAWSIPIMLEGCELTHEADQHAALNRLKTGLADVIQNTP